MGFWAQNFIGGLNQNPQTMLFAKFIFTSILKVSDKFIQKFRNSRVGIDTWPK